MDRVRDINGSLAKGERQKKKRIKEKKNKRKRIRAKLWNQR
jgi:hypothetical protein